MEAEPTRIIRQGCPIRQTRVDVCYGSKADELGVAKRRPLQSRKRTTVDRRAAPTLAAKTTEMRARRGRVLRMSGDYRAELIPLDRWFESGQGANLPNEIGKNTGVVISCGATTGSFCRAGAASARVRAGVLLDWRHGGVNLVIILHHEVDIGRKFHGLGERFQF